MVVAGVQILILLKSYPNGSYINKSETFMSQISWLTAGSTFARATMGDAFEKLVSNKTRPVIRKHCKSNPGVAADITESMKPVLECANRLMAFGNLKGESTTILPSPQTETYEKMKLALVNIDPSFKGLELDQFNSTMLKKFPVFLQKRKEFFRHDAPYCKIMINPNTQHQVPDDILNEVLIKKIPIPQVRKDPKHYADFHEVFGTPESLIPVVLPLDTKTKKRPKGFSFAKTNVRGWIICSNCQKKRAFFTKLKSSFNDKVQKNLDELLEDIHWCCGESLIPPHSYDVLPQRVYVDTSLNCSSKMETFYYSLKIQPLICHTCCDVLNDDDKKTFKDLKTQFQTVQPCCQKIM